MEKNAVERRADNYKVATKDLKDPILRSGTRTGALGLHAIQITEVEQAANSLFSAFMDDPFFEYMFGPKRNVKGIVKTIHLFTLKYGIRYGEVYSPSEDIEGAAIWLPPDNTKITAWKSLQAGVLRLRKGTGVGLKDGLLFMKKMMSYSAYSERLHKKYAPSCHWYLLAIGIKKEYRGRGYGSGLLRPMLERCDAEGVPCYLETHNQENLSLYEHYGFEVREEGVLPGSDRRHWAMLRNPKERA
jgi:ribosomal protein S18 acetylase RimI-like enzyme